MDRTPFHFTSSLTGMDSSVWPILTHKIPMIFGCLVLWQGSGLSDGDWVTLGAHETDDLEVAIEHLRKEGRTSTIALWGRSMGAVTAILYSHRDPTIAGMVGD